MASETQQYEVQKYINPVGLLYQQIPKHAGLTHCRIFCSFSHFCFFSRTGSDPEPFKGLQRARRPQASSPALRTSSGGKSPVTFWIGTPTDNEGGVLMCVCINVVVSVSQCGGKAGKDACYIQSELST